MSGSIKRNGPAAAPPAARADIDVVDRRFDTITQYLPPTDLADARFQIETAVDRFSALDPTTVDAVGARHFVVIPLHYVESAP
jgi:hypothetical protein